MFKGIKFIWPLMVWLWLLRDFVTGAIPVNMDTHTIYGVTKFYFNNLLNGTVPLWDPFVNLGRPFYAIAICNLFNPVTLLVPILKVLGFNYQIAFNIYIITYFFITALGFYALCRQLIKTPLVAYLGYLGFLFSSFGLSVFTQFTLLEIIAPCIWLLFFSVAWLRQPSLKHMVGILFSMMGILCGYLPFYALLWLLVAGFVTAVIYFNVIPHWFKQIWSWLSQRPVFIVVAGLCLCCAAAPLLTYKLIDSQGDIVAPGRHCQYVDQETCVERTLHEAGGMRYEEITRSGTLGERLDLGYLMFHLDKITYGSDSLFFLPFFFYLIIMFSWARSLDKRTAWFLLTGFIMALIALGAQSPVHPWLYKTIPLMKYFRNLFFLNAFVLLSVLIAALVMLDQWFIHNAQNKTSKKAIVLSVLLAGGVLVYWMLNHQGVLLAQWFTIFAVLCSLIVLLLPWQQQIKQQQWFWVMLVLLVPLVMMMAYAKNAKEFATVLPNQHTQPVFSWIRPTASVTNSAKIYEFVPYQDFFYAMSMTDAPATVGYPQSVAKYTFQLSQRIGDNELSKQAGYKILLYDDPLSQLAVPVSAGGQGVEVKHFDVNQLVLSTAFNQPKFLVYQDSFTKFWQVYIDDKKANLERANDAFKGVWVAGGKHEVAFRYEPLGGGWIYLITTVALLSVFLLLMILHLAGDPNPLRGPLHGEGLGRPLEVPGMRAQDPLAVRLAARNFILYALMIATAAFIVDWPTVHQQRALYLLGIFYNGHFSNCRDGKVYADYIKRVGLIDDRFKQEVKRCE